MEAGGTHKDCAGCGRHRSALAGLLRGDALRRALVLLPPVVLGAFALGVSVWTCPLLGATGCRCPGCGLTRAVGALGRGDFAASFALHPLASGFLVGWLILVVAEVMGPARRQAFASAVARAETRVPVSNAFLAVAVVFGVGRLLWDVAAVVRVS